VYRVKCQQCGKIFDEYAKVNGMNKIKCKCGGSTKWVPTTCNYQSVMFGKENKPLVLEHMTEVDDPNTVKVTTKSQLRRACEEHNCISPILD